MSIWRKLLKHRDEKLSDLSKIRLIVVDVDGTMTDGGIYYSQQGDEIKKFNSRDAAGYFTAHAVGIKIMVLTGRECYATTRRMKELNIDYVCQDVKDKYSYLEKFMADYNYGCEEVAYIGDDLNDLFPMQLVGFVGCPLDAYPEIKAVADYVSEAKGGEGAVRDFIQYILKERGQWEEAYHKVYKF